MNDLKMRFPAYAIDHCPLKSMHPVQTFSILRFNGTDAQLRTNKYSPQFLDYMRSVERVSKLLTLMHLWHVLNGLEHFLLGTSGWHQQSLLHKKLSHRKRLMQHLNRVLIKAVVIFPIDSQAPNHQTFSTLNSVKKHFVPFTQIISIRCNSLRTIQTEFVLV